MFNVTGGELLIILLVALIVLGPEKLPDAVRKAGRVYGEVRRMANGFQDELRQVIDEPTRELRGTMADVRSSFDDAAGFGQVDDEPDPPFAVDLRTAADVERDRAAALELPGEPLDDDDDPDADADDDDDAGDDDADDGGEDGLIELVEPPPAPPPPPAGAPPVRPVADPGT